MLIVLAVAAFLLAACSDAAPEWTLVNVAGWDSQPGFTLRIPPGWQARQTEGADSYVGEVVGDGVRLVFDYGGDPNLANYPERDYTVVHEDIGGFEATLFTSSAGWTGISFPQLNGPSLTIYGHDLTREQQLLAFAIFRSVRSGYVADGAFIEELGASAPTPQVFHSGGPAVTSFVYEGVEYEPVAGPIRAELLDVERLKSTGLMLTDKELLKGSEGRRVYTLSGVPIEEGFLVGSMQTGFGRPDIWYLRTETAYPVCQPGSSALIYTAVGASPPPPPYGPVTPQPSYTGGPTPTPRPTPATPVVAAPLSSKGLLDAGWPQVNMERLQVGLGGVEYLHTSSRYINEYNLDTSIPSAALEELETLAISYFIDVGPLPSPLLDEMASDAAVTDHVRVYRLTARPIEEVIVVDQCPADLHGDQFVLYLPKEDKAHIDDDDSMSRGVELTAIDTHYDNNSISLWWEDPDWDVDYWVVERAMSQDGLWVVIAAKRPRELRPQEEPPHAYDRWADAKLPPGDRYYYRIYSCAESGRSGYSNVASGGVPEFMPGLEPPIEAKEAVDPPC